MSIIETLQQKEEIIWLNPSREKVDVHQKINGYGYVYLKAAQKRFMRFLPYIAEAFPETAEKKGVIESSLIPIPAMKEWLNSRGASIQGTVFLKDDAHLPIGGSVKARGGVHEVLKIAESLAMEQQILTPGEKYSVFSTEPFRSLFSGFTIHVGSTGNLGLSVGRTAAKLGFKCVVYMSQEAEDWKKDLLQREGVTVQQIQGNYSEAVAAGRKAADEDPKGFFIDDEASEDLFFGYSTAALRLKVQLGKMDIPVDEEHPLFVYLPCGVGGAPAGITYGLKQVFGNAVHCFFGEPVQCPPFLLGLSQGEKKPSSVQEIGLTGETTADALAVPRASAFACRMMRPLVSGIFTLAEERFTEYQQQLLEKEQIFMEPSACAGFLGLEQLQKPDSGWKDYLEAEGLTDQMAQAVHVVWGTGGGLMEKYGASNN